MKRHYLFTIILFLAGSFLISCGSDDENPDPGLAPEIPETATFLMDFEDFQQSNGRIDASTHWATAAIKVGVWNVLIGVTFAIPVAAFKASLTNTPEYDFDRKLWVWTFEYDFVGRGYTSELTADIGESEITWEMHISQEMGFQDFLWYSGTSAVDGSSGFWVLYKEPENASQWLRIDWEKSGDDIGSIQYTNVSGTESDGGYIAYGRTDGVTYNTYYTINNVENGNIVEIEWHRENKIGRIKDPLAFGDEDYRCWDENFQDSECPQ